MTLSPKGCIQSFGISGRQGVQKGGPGSSGGPIPAPATVLLARSELQEVVGTRLEPGRALGLESAANGDIHGLFDRARRSGAIASVVRNPLAVAVHIGDHLAQVPTSVVVLASRCPQLAEARDQRVDLALERQADQRWQVVAARFTKGGGEPVFQVPDIEEIDRRWKMGGAHLAEDRAAIADEEKLFGLVRALAGRQQRQLLPKRVD